MNEGKCVACGAPYWPPTGALCTECDDVIDTFTPKMWARVNAMTSEGANAFLLKRKAQLIARRKIKEAPDV